MVISVCLLGTMVISDWSPRTVVISDLSLGTMVISNWLLGNLITHYASKHLLLHIYTVFLLKPISSSHFAHRAINGQQ